jgi:hypothetical protein
LVSTENEKWECFRFSKPEFDELDLLDYSDEEVSNICKEVEAALIALKKAFAKATKVGKSHLILLPGYHDAESEGDRHDDIDGFYWAVDGMYCLSSPGKKFQKEIGRKHFVVCKDKINENFPFWQRCTCSPFPSRHCPLAKRLFYTPRLPLGRRGANQDREGQLSSSCRHHWQLHVGTYGAFCEI